jgi:hypothetical protein
MCRNIRSRRSECCAPCEGGRSLCRPA